MKDWVAALGVYLGWSRVAFGNRFGWACRLIFVVAVSVHAMARGEGGLPKPEEWTGSKFQGTPDAPAPYEVELAFPKLKFVSPVAMVPLVGSDRLFVAELHGKILSFRNDTGCTKLDVTVDLVKRHPDLSALYGLAFHPDFRKTRYVYVCYVLKNDLPDGSVVARFRMSDADPPTIDLESEQVLLRFWSGGHNGGCLEFGKDGYLYISTGDGAAPSPPDSLMTGQDCSDLLSSILRIDVNHAEGGKPYAIPGDNPFVKLAGVRGEIWAFGFRNPWRMSFDRETGDLWVGDVGWELWESVMKVERGSNFGWSVMEGPQPVNVGSRVGPAAITRPIKSHPHSEAASITGGVVYRGTRLAELRGSYVYGDFQSGTVWGLRADGQRLTWQAELARTPLHLVAFGTDEAGELYLVDHDRTHQIYRLAPRKEERQGPPFPTKLSETGLFATTSEHRMARGVVGYEINSTMWSDGMRAERFMAIPGKGQIAFDREGNWRFPEGSVLARTVLAESEGMRPGRRVETQVLHLEKEAWRPYSYVWDDDQKDARLAEPGGGTKTVTIETGTEHRERAYHVSARTECITCHNPWVEKKTTVYGFQSASPLAINTPQMNRLVSSAGKQVEQMTRLYEYGLLASRPEPGTLPKFADPYDVSASLDKRARGYLQTNCAHCHLDGAGGSANIGLGYGLTLAETKTVGVKPIQGMFDIDDARIIAAGDPTRSVLYYRVAKMGGGRMPRAGSNEVDARGVKLIHDWIAAMPTDGANAKVDRSSLRALGDGDQTRRKAAIERLAATTRGALGLVGWMDDAGGPEVIRREVVEAGRKSSRVETRDLFERFVPEAERVARLGDLIDRRALLVTRGDAARGRRVFFESSGAQCKVCHKVGELGQSVGPELSKIGGKYSREALLEQILEPSKVIEPAYVLQMVELKDGRVLSGLLVGSTVNEVCMKDAQGKVEVVARGEVERMVPQGRSMMPEGLLKDLTLQEGADLLAYLAGLR